MNHSIIERIFPHPPGSHTPPAIVLGDYEEREPSAATPKRWTAPSAASSSSAIAVKSPPLSASTLHYEDAFLPVERAAKALQRNIQTYLDAQSERLTAHARHDEDDGDNLSSVASPSLSASLNRSTTTTSWRRDAGIKTVPIRQPPRQKISLRGSRRGLARAMDQLVQLKEQELRIIERESQGRERALQQTEAFKSKKTSLQAEIEAMKGEDNKAAATSLREAADRVQAEIGELEKRLIELRTRHAHLVDHAQQLENAHDSKLSSYTSSLALLEKEMAQFLRTPPVRSSLSAEHGSTTSATGAAGMYALRPDRRTLEMAQEQWEREQSQLAQRKADVESERGALEQGARLWQDTVQKISDYEQELGKLLDTLVADVSSALTRAESRGWNLLICCLGAELEALQEARVLLGGGSDGLGEGDQPSKDSAVAATEAADLLNGIDTSPGGVAGGAKASVSNESLEDTLRAFHKDSEKEDMLRAFDKDSEKEDVLQHTDHSHVWQKEHVEADTDNDEPSPDFLVSHS
ncbi:hypothetical protein DV735_g5773, partial [Chaetothyriales sp. CBS 134920]